MARRPAATPPAGRGRRGAAGIGLAVAGALLALASPATAAGRRRVAVLEFRAGVEAAPRLGERLAELARHETGWTIAGPLEARRRLGARADADLARCAGDSECVATLGDALDVDEIVLVGLSQLGDLVVALQRIDVPRRRVEARLAESMPPGEALPDERLSSYLHRLLPDDAFRRFGTILVRSSEPAALVELDGRAVGTTPLVRPLRLPAPGRYRLRLSKAGFVDFRAAIDVPPDGAVEVAPSLERRGVVRELAWYQRWWVWAAAGVIMTGATAATLLVVNRDEADAVPVIVELP